MVTDKCPSLSWKVKGIEIEANWSDHYHGEKEAEISINLMRKGKSIATKSIFGAYQRNGL